MANLITTLRLGLLLLLVWLAYAATPAVQLLNAPLLVTIFVLDGVDGWIARKRREESLFGSVYDIAADRIVENVLWLTFATLGLVPLWVSVLFITRGVLVDSIRGVATAHGRKPFSVGHGIGQALVAGRFMRGAYGAIKAVTFGWIFLIQPWPALLPQVWLRWSGALEGVTTALVWLSVAVCLLRAVPVLLSVLPHPAAAPVTSPVRVRDPLR